MNEVNSSDDFSIFADKTLDISGTELFALCARHVSSSNEIREDFLSFVFVQDLTG